MSAVYDDAKQKALHRPARGFATMHDEPVEALTGMTEYSSSSLGQYVGSAFITGARVIYAWHSDPQEIGERAKLLPLRGGQIFPLVGETSTSTMSLGGAWITSEPEVYSSGVVTLPWARKVIYSGKVKFKTAQLRRRAPRTIIGDFNAEEGNG
jgi:hypothetical protein